MTRQHEAVIYLSVLPFVFSPAWAGSLFSFSCEGPAGHIEERVVLGGGFKFEQITGFCLSAKRFVYLIWKRHDPAPVPLRVWDPKTGDVFELYRAEDCPEPIIPIRAVEQLDRLPICRQGSLKFQIEGLFD